MVISRLRPSPLVRLLVRMRQLNFVTGMLDMAVKVYVKRLQGFTMSLPQQLSEWTPLLNEAPGWMRFGFELFRACAELGQVQSDQVFEGGDETVGGFRRQVEPELLDGNQAARVGLIGAEDGSKNARSNLMEDPEGSESVGWRGAGSVRMQRVYSSMDGHGW